jgi:flagellar FliL protein
MSEPTPPADAATAAAPAKSKKSLILILGGVLAVAGVGGGVFWYMRKPVSAEAAHAKAKEPEHGVLGFEPFVVNLADPNAQRFLRTTVQLVVESEKDAERYKKTPVIVMQARGAILEILTTQTADVLVTPEGKAKLKKAIAERLGEAVEEMKVKDVLFSDFVVQF